VPRRTKVLYIYYDDTLVFWGAAVTHPQEPNCFRANLEQGPPDVVRALLEAWRGLASPVAMVSILLVGNGHVGIPHRIQILITADFVGNGQHHLW
jgi:hypothetical protein